MEENDTLAKDSNIKEEIAMKKRLFSGFLALVLALTVLPCGAWAAETQKVVHASTTEELRAALKSNTKIILEGKDYNVKTGEFDYTLELNGLQNVTIQGTTGTRLLGYIIPEITDSGYNGLSAWGNIIRIGYSDNIVLQDLAIGYDKLPADYTDPAVRMDGKFSVTMVDCEIFGASCGLQLGTEEDTDGTFHMENSTIRDCFNYIMEENCMKAGTATFTNCTFSGNGYGDSQYRPEYSLYGYGFEEKAIATFTDCVFSNNKNPHRELMETVEGIESGPFGVYNNCTFEGNAWSEVPSSAPAKTPAKTPAAGKTPAEDKTPAPAVPAPSPSTTPSKTPTDKKWTIPNSIPNYSDVPEGYWAYREIYWATGWGLMNGVGDGKFDPGAKVTQQQTWMVLARLNGDSPANMAEATEWITENVYTNLVNPPLKGGPTSQGRQNLVSMLYTYAGKKNIRGPGMADLKDFPDKPEEKSYEYFAMSWAVGSGLISGTSDGRLDPGGKITRAQFAVIMYRFFENILNAPPPRF